MTHRFLLKILCDFVLTEPSTNVEILKMPAADGLGRLMAALLGYVRRQRGWLGRHSNSRLELGTATRLGPVADGSGGPVGTAGLSAT